jgi:hypothetical protein
MSAFAFMFCAVMACYGIHIDSVPLMAFGMICASLNAGIYSLCETLTPKEGDQHERD